MSWLTANCPRLAKARDDHNRWLHERCHDRLVHADLLYRAEKLLAHRELQAIRAGATSDARYIRKREGKLLAARALVDQLRRAA